MAKTKRILIRCEAKSYLDGRSFAFGDVADIEEKDANCLLKSGEGIETSLPVTTDAKGNDLPDERYAEANAAAVRSVNPDGGSAKGRKQRKLVTA